MNRDSFLHTLRLGLAGLPPEDIEEIVDDYSAHFAESAASGRQEAEVAAALGDPARIARELKADAGLRRFEATWSVPNMLAAVLALAGLAIVDVIVLLPLLIVMTVTALALAVALLAIGALGVKVIVTALLFLDGGTLTAVVSHLSIGAGLVSCFIGAGALLLLGTGAGIRLLGQYARLHFQLAQPVQHRV